MTSTALACLRAADREETTRANEVVNVSINPRISTKIRLIFKRSSFIIPDYLLFSSSSYLREVFIVNWNYFPLKCKYLEINEYYDASTIRSTFFEFHISFARFASIFAHESLCLCITGNRYRLHYETNLTNRLQNHRGRLESV